MNHAPLVSIVMPSFNQRSFILESIESVLSQDYPNIELIIMDGGSSDGTQDVLTGAASQFPARVRWKSEMDTGPAQAVNKALHLGRGNFFGWLNSDDLYAPGAITRAISALIVDPNLLLLYGEAEHIDSNGAILGKYPTRPVPILLDDFNDGCPICQPSVFFRRDFIELNGDLDECLQTAFDFDWWLRAFKSFPERISNLSDIQAFSRLHDDGITRNFRRLISLESMKILARHVGDPPPHWALTYVEELYRQYPYDERVPDLRAHVDMYLAEIENTVAVSTANRAHEILVLDARLQTALPGVFAQVYADFWAGNSLEIRMRRSLSNERTLRMHCAHHWPNFEPLVIAISTSWGRRSRLIVDKAGPFVIDISIPAGIVEQDSYITAESDRYFVPNLVEAGSQDQRHLTFKLERLEMI